VVCVTNSNVQIQTRIQMDEQLLVKPHEVTTSTDLGEVFIATDITNGSCSLASRPSGMVSPRRGANTCINRDESDE
jgi:hypothetical protein